MYDKSNLGISLSPSQQSSSIDNSTFETSRCGSQTVKPRPIKSMAARRNDVCIGNFGDAGANNRYVNALPAKVAYLLSCLHNDISILNKEERERTSQSC